MNDNPSMNACRQAQKGDKSSDLVGKEEVTYQRNKTMIQRPRTPSVVVAAARSLSLPSPP